MDGIDIIAGLWMFSNYVILCPTMLYYLRRFHLIGNNEETLKYRSKPIIYIFNLIAFIILLIERLYANAVGVWLIIDINWIYYLTFSTVWWSGFFLFLIKVFYLYYKQQYAISIADMAWKTEINPIEKDINWYIINKNTYGNPIYCVKMLFIPYIVSVFINTIISYTFGESLVLDFTQFIIASIPVIISFILFYKSRKLDDVHQIRDETLYQCMMLVVAGSLYLLIFLFFKLNIRGIDIRMEWLLRNLVADLCAIGLALIPTAYPVRLHNSTHLIYKLSLDFSGSAGGSMNIQQTESVTNITSVMSEYKSFKSFMKHLILEFCPETLLFLVELVQIKHAYLKKAMLSSSDHGIDDKDVVLNRFRQEKRDAKKEEIYSFFHGLHKRSGKLTKISIPSEVPQSIILTEKVSLRDQMEVLYHKYIAEGSVQEVNIASGQRIALRGVFEYNMMPSPDLINCMDETAMGLLLLLQDPFRRFKDSHTTANSLSFSGVGIDATPKYVD